MAVQAVLDVKWGLLVRMTKRFGAQQLLALCFGTIGIEQPHAKMGFLTSFQSLDQSPEFAIFNRNSRKHFVGGVPAILA